MHKSEDFSPKYRGRGGRLSGLRVLAGRKKRPRGRQGRGAGTEGRSSKPGSGADWGPWGIPT